MSLTKEFFGSHTVEPPAIEKLSSDSITILQTNAGLLSKLGFGFRLLSNSRVQLYRAPVLCGTVLDIRSLYETLFQLKRLGSVAPNFLPAPFLRVLAMKACRRAVKFGDTMTTRQAEELLQNLARCRTPFQCAHGRPSIVPLLRLTRSCQPDTFQCH